MTQFFTKKTVPTFFLPQLKRECFKHLKMVNGKCGKDMTSTFPAAIWHPSPNSRPRRADESVRLVVLHGTWMTSDAEALARLCDPQTEVSAHYYITREGTVYQLVAESHVAWHAGKSTWKGVENGTSTVNGCSLGVELGNAGPFATPPSPGQEAQTPDWSQAEPYTPAQYAALKGLLADILSRYPALSPACVVGHSDVSPGRKTDPGAHFAWAYLVQAGVASRPVSQ